MAKVCSPLLILCGLEVDFARYFKSPTGALLGIYAACYFIPSIFTAFIGDFISTRMGRRWCIIIANIIITIGCLVNTFASSIGMWCAGNYLSPSCDVGLSLIGIVRSCYYRSWCRYCEGRGSCIDPRDRPSSASTYSWLLLPNIRILRKLLRCFDDL